MRWPPSICSACHAARLHESGNSSAQRRKHAGKRNFVAFELAKAAEDPTRFQALPSTFSHFFTANAVAPLRWRLALRALAGHRVELPHRCFGGLAGQVLKSLALLLRLKVIPSGGTLLFSSCPRLALSLRARQL